MDYDQYKLADDDVFICENPLEGEGRWVYYWHFMDKTGAEYQIWQDQDGDEKVVEL